MIVVMGETRYCHQLLTTFRNSLLGARPMRTITSVNWGGCRPAAMHKRDVTVMRKG